MAESQAALSIFTLSKYIMYLYSTVGSIYLSDYYLIFGGTYTFHRNILPLKGCLEEIT